MPARRPEPLPHDCGAVALRRLAPADLRAFQAYRGDAVLGRYQGWSAQSDDAAEAFLREMQAIPLFQPGAWTQLGIADAATGALLGDIGVRIAADQAEAEVGFTLSAPHQGRGLAAAAVTGALRLVFACTQVPRVIGITDARNAASIRLLERVGLRRVATREALFRGEACVELVYAVMRGGAE